MPLISWAISGSMQIPPSLAASSFRGLFLANLELGNKCSSTSFSLRATPTVTLEDLVNAWADEDGGQFLYGAPDALVLQLQRFQLKEGTWTKHNRELDILTDINIPFSDHETHVHNASYRIVGLVTHQGEGHQNGHYQTILLMDNAMWLGEDEAYPTPLGQLTQQQKCEILQILLIKEPANELVEDTQAEYALPAAKRHKSSLETLTLIFGNVATYGPKVQDWTWTRPDSLLFLQETHLKKETLKAVQYYSTRGWKAYGVPAQAVGQGGVSGGFLTLNSTRHLTHQASHFVHEGNGMQILDLPQDRGDSSVCQQCPDPESAASIPSSSSRPLHHCWRLAE